MFRRPVALCLLGLTLTTVLASPADPEAWDVRLRYGINAFRAERIKQFEEMTRSLAAAGFERARDDAPADDEAENPKADRLRGTIPNKGVARLLAQRHVRAALFTPKGAKLPAEGPVRVEVRLASGLLPEAQRALARQTAEVLRKDTGFVEAFGYDHREATRLVGSVPADRLDALLADVRTLPAARGAVAPLRNTSPVRAVFVRPGWPVPAARPAPAAVPAGQEKFSADLRALLADAAKAKVPARLEVILSHTPTVDDRAWHKAVEQTGAVVEGRLGPLVTVLAVPAVAAAKLAALPDVIAVRRPRPPLPAPVVVKDWLPLHEDSTARLPATNQGRGARVAVVAADFAGWQTLGKDRVHLIDLTAARSRDLKPDPFATAAGKGPGTRAAAFLREALPHAELTLVRVDPAAPYLLQELARAINGSPVTSISLADRLRELQVDRLALDRRAETLVAERQRALADVGEEGESARRRKAYLASQAALDRDLNAYRDRVRRYHAFLSDLKALRGVGHVATTLVWADGHPARTGSGLGLYFEPRPFAAAAWFRPAPAAAVWSGPFRDADSNGLMEFAPPGSRLPRGAWTREVNFLTWPSRDGGTSATLPAGARVRLTLQWREPHDPLPARRGEDPYREPLARLGLVVVRQPDPAGAARPADDLVVVAESTGTPRRLEQTANAATYEATVELSVAEAGRYGVLVVGRLPDSVLPPGEARLPGTRKFGDLRVRLTAYSAGGEAGWGTLPR